jgi:hypothetical protein
MSGMVRDMGSQLPIILCLDRTSSVLINDGEFSLEAALEASALKFQSHGQRKVSPYTHL